MGGLHVAYLEHFFWNLTRFLPSSVCDLHKKLVRNKVVSQGGLDSFEK